MPKTRLIKPHKEICANMKAMYAGYPEGHLHDAQECWLALTCDDPEGCGFLTNFLSFGLIVFCSLLKL